MYFLPWVGLQYRQALNGYKILILGDSHYGVKSRHATVGHLATHIKHGNYPFWSKIEDILVGVELDKIGRHSFWNSCAFANICHRSMDGVTSRPTREDWRVSQTNISGLLRELRPNLICVFSARGWDYGLPDHHEFAESHYHPEITSLNSRRSYIYKFDSKEAGLAISLNHPRNLAYSADAWSIWVKDIIDRNSWEK